MASTADDSLGVHASNNVSRFFTREEEQVSSFLSLLFLSLYANEI